MLLSVVVGYTLFAFWVFEQSRRVASFITASDF